MKSKAKVDRNFDDLIERFEQRIYGTPKGQWRLQLIKEDLSTLHASNTPLQIWDAGCGLGQISLWLAEQGHRIILCDISEKMLKKAQAAFTRAQIPAQFHQCPAQTLAPELPEFDLVLCHALVEWLAQPMPSLHAIVEKVKKGGWLSLLFYNQNALVYTHVLKGGWHWRHILQRHHIGKGKKLTPPHPQSPHKIRQSLHDWGFSIIRQTGIRVFYDYLPAETRQDDLQELWQLEQQYCRQPGFRDMGRYIHILAKRV